MVIAFILQQIDTHIYFRYREIRISMFGNKSPRYNSRNWNQHLESQTNSSTRRVQPFCGSKSPSLNCFWCLNIVLLISQYPLFVRNKWANSHSSDECTFHLCLEVGPHKRLCEMKGWRLKIKIFIPSFLQEIREMTFFHGTHVVENKRNSKIAHTFSSSLGSFSTSQEVFSLTFV